MASNCTIDVRFKDCQTLRVAKKLMTWGDNHVS